MDFPSVTWTQHTSVCSPGNREEQGVGQDAGHWQPSDPLDDALPSRLELAPTKVSPRETARWNVSGSSTFPIKDNSYFFQGCRPLWEAKTNCLLGSRRSDHPDDSHLAASHAWGHQAWRVKVRSHLLRDADPFQNGWIFGKVPNGLCPPPPHFRKIILRIFYKAVQP